MTIDRHMATRGSRRGQGLTEYVILVVLVAIALITGVWAFGNTLYTRYVDATVGVMSL